MMGTNEPGDRRDDWSSGDWSGGQGGGNPYPPYPEQSGQSYSGYREGVHGEPVPNSAWQDPAGTGNPPPYPPVPYNAPLPGTYPPPGGYQQGGYPQGGYPPQPGPYPPYRPTNGMAVAAMVLGILWIYWVGSVLALIFGYVARQQIRERGEGGDGMAVAGIVLGWIGVGILVLILLFGVLGGIGAAAYQ